MIYLLLSIVLSSSLFLFFKWFDNKKLSLLSAICGNYIACISIGLSMNGGINIELISQQNLGWVLVLGILFFVIFYTMAHVASTIGVGVSSAASKLSLIIPVVYGAFILNEPLSFLRIMAVLLAIPAVLLMTYKPSEKINLNQLLLPFVIFIGSGIIDVSINLIQKNLNGHNPASIIILIFSMAFLSALVYSILKKHQLLKEGKGVLYGILLGIPNYFSIHFMVLALRSNFLNSGQFYLVNNASVMLLTFLLAWLFFSEKLNWVKIIGIVISLLSIYFILFG